MNSFEEADKIRTERDKEFLEQMEVNMKYQAVERLMFMLKHWLVRFCPSGHRMFYNWDFHCFTCDICGYREDA